MTKKATTMSPADQPTFCLHNGQILLVNNSASSSLIGSSKKNFSMIDIDDLSFTSSTMSDDEASWGDDDSIMEDNDDDSAISNGDQDEQHAKPMDDTMSTNDQSNISVSRNRSTASLSALMNVLSRQRTPTSNSMPLQVQNSFSKPSSTSMPRPNSMADFSLADAVKAPASHQAIQRVSAQEATSANTQGAMKPDDYLCEILDTKLDRVPYDSLGDYFLKTTPEHIAAWDGEVLRAIRTQDLDLLKKLHHEQGKPLQACNQFGETILHVCVRRGTPEILKYLLEQGHVSPRVHCDYGRTCLHDALWVFNNPNSVRMAAILIAMCPEMLLVTDKRGFSPLDYVPRDRWGDCCRFLDRAKPFLSRLKNNGKSK